jgi:hypothetical protein
MYLKINVIGKPRAAEFHVQDVRKQARLVSMYSKAVPLHATKALGGERYSSYSFTTSALDGG